MKIQEAPEEITEGGIVFPSPKTSYMEENTQKTRKKAFKRMKTAPMRLGLPPCAMYLGQGIFTLMQQAMHLGHAGSGLELFFFLLLSAKTPIFKP